MNETTHKPQLQLRVTDGQVEAALHYYQTNAHIIHRRVQLLVEEAAKFYGAYLMLRERDSMGNRAWFVYQYEKYTEAS